MSVCVCVCVCVYVCVSSYPVHVTGHATVKGMVASATA